MSNTQLNEVSNQEVAEALASQFTANDLRKWMNANDLQRSRGSNKMESAKQAVEQGRDQIIEFLLANNALDVDYNPKCVHYGVCSNRTAGANASVCDECSDAIRRNGRSADRANPDNFEDIESYIAEIRDRHL